jgi:uncharacterized protein (DUF433 family)
MSIGVTYPHIEKVEGEPARLERMPRIRVAQLVQNYRDYAGSIDEICNQFPHLKPAEVHSAMAYYFDHQAEIDQEIDDEIKLVDEWRKNTPPSPVMLRLRSQGLLPPTED